MSKKNTVPGNYLDHIPTPSDAHPYEVSEDGKVTIFVENKGFFHWIARNLFHRPRISQIHLDEMGNYIWPLMDGNRTIQDIALLVKEEFGEKAEPLYNRLVQYMRNLESYGFIGMSKKN